MVLLEVGFAVACVAVVILFIAPLILRGWEAYCGWVFKGK